MLAWVRLAMLPPITTTFILVRPSGRLVDVFQEEQVGYVLRRCVCYWSLLMAKGLRMAVVVLCCNEERVRCPFSCGEIYIDGTSHALSSLVDPWLLADVVRCDRDLVGAGAVTWKSFGPGCWILEVPWHVVCCRPPIGVGTSGSIMASTTYGTLGSRLKPAASGQVRASHAASCITIK
jgi:hypothetical protein